MPLALILLFQTQEAKYDVLAGGKKIGVATYSVASRPAGGRITRLRMSFLGQTTDETSESDARGAAVRSTSLLRRGRATTRETVAYGSRGEATIVRDGGKPLVVPAPRGSRNDPSELWFRTVAPAPGTWGAFQSLDARRGAWDAVRVTYVGKKGAGNLVRQLRKGAVASYSLDDKGLPIAIESASFRLVRR